MGNSELRMKALAKVKDKNFSVLSAAAYAIAALALLAADITGIMLLDAAIMLLVSLAVGLISGAGYIKVSMGMWRQAKGGFGELFSCYSSLDAIKRGALPAGVYAVMLMLFRYGVLSGIWYIALVSGIVCIVLHIAASWGGYAIEFESGSCPVKAFGNGLKLAVKNAGRILEMKAYLYWWIAAAVAVTIVLCSGSLSGPFMALVVFLVGLVCRWMVGAFIALAEAGLAREAYRS